MEKSASFTGMFVRMVASAGFDYTSFKAHARKSLMPVAYYGFGSEEALKTVKSVFSITRWKLLQPGCFVVVR